MKKRVFLVTLMVTLCLALTACGNPLKLLPEADDECNIYDDSEKTTGNEVADTILKTLKKDGVIDKDIKEVYVEDRDDKESGDRSLLKIGVFTENKEISYEHHFDVTVKYSDDKDSWKVKEYNEDIDKKVITPLSGVDEEKVEKDVATLAYSVDMDGVTVYILDGNYETKIENSKIEPGKGNSLPSAIVTVLVNVDDGICKYERNLNIHYLYADYGVGWHFDSLDWDKDFKKEYSDEFNKFFTADNVMNDVGASKVNLFNDYLALDKSMFNAYELGDMIADSYDVKVPVTAHFKNSEFMDVSIDFEIDYYAKGGDFSSPYFSKRPEVSVDYSPLVGIASATVYDKYNDSEELGKIEFTFDKASASSISGQVTYTPTGSKGGSVKTATFTGCEYVSWGENIPGMIELTLDNEIEWAKYYSTDTIYLCYMPENGHLSSSNTTKALFELER